MSYEKKTKKIGNSRFRIYKLCSVCKKHMFQQLLDSGYEVTNKKKSCPNNDKHEVVELRRELPNVDNISTEKTNNDNESKVKLRKCQICGKMVEPYFILPLYVDGVKKRCCPECSKKVLQRRMVKFKEFKKNKSPIAPTLLKDNGSINKEKLLLYYGSPLVYSFVMRSCRARRVMMASWYGKVVMRRNQRGKPITFHKDDSVLVDPTPNYLWAQNHQHGVEVVPELQRFDEDSDYSDRIIIDLDAGHMIEWDMVKSVSYDTAIKSLKLVNKESNIESVRIKFSGSKGFHYVFDLINPIEWEEGKTMLEDGIIAKINETYPDLVLPPSIRMTQKSERYDKVFLDLSSNKSRGVIKSEMSLHIKTANIAEPIFLAEDILNYRPISIDNFIKSNCFGEYSKTSEECKNCLAKSRCLKYSYAKRKNYPEIFHSSIGNK